MAEVSNDHSIFACPHCGGAFASIATGVVCPKGHSFDRAREGYLNLLVGGRLSGSTTPGDTAESLAARRRFLNTGSYAPIVHALSATIGTTSGAVLDVGCGEGYYLSHINAPQKFGLDISKRGIQMASKTFPTAHFVVGNAYRLPVLDNSCAVVFSVFAPHAIDEFIRVLEPQGKWITVTPASQHLTQMRPKKDEQITQREIRRETPPEHATYAERIQFNLNLSHDDAHDLFTMTPLLWQTAAHASPTQHVSVDVWVASGTKP